MQDNIYNHFSNLCPCSSDHVIIIMYSIVPGQCFLAITTSRAAGKVDI